jgi:hypothetical protein
MTGAREVWVVRRGVIVGSRGRELALGLFVILGLPILVAVGYVAVRDRLLDREYARVAATLPAELAAAKREGIPTEPADLRRNPPVPAALNAAPLYRRAYAIQEKRRVAATPPGWKSSPLGMRPSTKEEKTEAALLDAIKRGRLGEKDRVTAKAFLRARDRELRLADAAARLPHCDFQRRYEDDPFPDMPENAAASRLVRLLLVRAAVAADESRPDGALRSAVTAARVARHIGQQGSLIDALAQAGMMSVADRAWQRAVLMNQDRHDILRSARAVSGELDAAPDLVRATGAEIVQARGMMSQVRRDPSALGAEEEGLSAAGMTRMHSASGRALVAGASEARAVAHLRAVSAALRQDLGDPGAQVRALTTLEDRLKANEKKPTYDFTWVLYPIYSTAAARVAAVTELGRLRRTMLDIVEFRQKRGRYPSSPAELPRKQEPDIFTGKSPAYRTIQGGFLLYSVGRDRKDDGGSSRTDLVVRWPLAP